MTKIIVHRIFERARLVKNACRLFRFPKPSVDLDWDDQPYNTNTDLESDQAILRDLEAEIYALTDQFNTEQDLSGVSSA